MEASIKLGRVWGIPIGLHNSWFLILFLVTFSLAAGYFPDGYPDLPAGAYWVLGLLTAGLFFGSVLVHELAHAFFALRNGIPVRGITLFIFGGVAQIEEEPRTPGAEFRIAIAGPIASLSLAGLFGFIYLLDCNVSAYLAAPSIWLARINLALAVFNMIPGFPLDGGRVLRALIWQITGRMGQATRIAAGVGQLVALGFMGWGAFALLAGGLFNGLWLIFIGWFLQNAAASNAVQAGLKEALSGVSVRQVMVSDCQYVPGQLSLRRLVEDQILSGSHHRCFFVAKEGQPQGLLTIQDVTQVSREEWDDVTTGQIMVPWDRAVRVTPETELYTALQIMGRADVAQLPVIEGERLVGMLSRQQILDYVRMRAQLGV